MSSEQEFKCVFCSETFSQKEDLQIHFRKHGDPNFNQKKHRGRSQDELDVSAETKDKVEVVECDVCPEVFSTISKAITHKHKVHPDHDTKYFCPWCGKLFTMKHLYNKHMLATHLDLKKSDNRFLHCDTCDVNFNIPAAIAYHNKFYHRQEELPTIGHSKKLKMLLEEVVQIFYCPFCGEEYDNKVNLHKHMTDDHSCENQRPEDVFRCPLCDAIFYYLDAYELHLTYHSIEDLYTERSEMMDELIDFSLETVQPLQEKIEAAEPVKEAEAVGIEELLEFTMDDTTDSRKHKKHKKHKKSKKAAITLDEFLNMNKDVFGEGIDFQGIEEVPTQVVAKRLKTKKVAPTTKFIPPDLAKLKRQGIVVKKQPSKTAKAIMMKKEAIKTQKSTNLTPQAKSHTLTSTNDVLSKLLNQGSQIKIVKKSNQDSDDQQDQENTVEERLCPKNMDANDEEITDNLSHGTDTEEDNTGASRENMDVKTNFNSPKQTSLVASNPGTPSIIGDNTDIKALPNSNENSNGSSNFDDDLEESPDQSETTKNITENLNVLRKNSNIAVKSSKQSTSDTKDEYTESDTNDDVGTTQVKELSDQENIERNTVSEKSSLIALKHLSHLITIKPISSSQTSLSDDNRHENGLQKVETTSISQISHNSSKTPDKTSLANLKNLGSITIKPTTQLNLKTLKNKTSVETRDNIDEYQETDEESNQDKIENKINTEKIAHMLKSPQLSVQTKHSPKESPKSTPNNDNSQSSADLLKHLKNVTAKPVNLNSPKIPTPNTSPSAIKKNSKTSLQKEVTDDGIEIFSIDDSDSDDANCNDTQSHAIIKTENNLEIDTSIDALKNINKNITVKSTNQQFKTVNNAEINSNKAINNDDGDDWDDDDGNIGNINKFRSSPKPNQKLKAINNVLKNLSKNITIKSRNSSPSQSIKSIDHDSRDSHLETNEADSDSDTPLCRIKITEIENNDDEIPESAENVLHGNVQIQHPDDSDSEHEDEPMDEEFDDMSDVECHVASAKVHKNHPTPNSTLNSLKNISKDLTIKSSNGKTPLNNKPDNPLPSDEIPQYAKKLSNQISIKQIKKPDSNKNPKLVEQTAAHSMNQSSMNKKIASSSNQLNSFNREVKTVKTFQTQTKTFIEEITTTVTKTIKTVNQTTKQEVRNMAQSSSAQIIPQKVQGLNAMFSQKNFQGVKVRQSVPNVRPRIRGQAPQATRPAICAPLQGARPAICAAPRAPNQLVPVRPALNRPSGPRSRMPNVMNIRPSTSGQQRPQIGKPVKVSPGAIFSPPKKSAEVTGHFSCFKKPKESLIPVPDFPLLNTDDGESSAQFSSAMQMSKSNSSCTTKTVKGNSVVTSTQMKSEMSASSQQLSRLRNMSGLSVVKTSQNAKQSHVEVKSEMTASKRNALEAIQKLQSQGLLVKKPRLDVSEGSDHSEPGSDDMGLSSMEEFDV